MKFLILFSLVVASSAIADEMPIAWRLRDAGYINCISKHVFYESEKCGPKFSEVFECEKKNSVPSVTPGFVPVTVLAQGEFQTDVGGGRCNPVRVIHHIIEANTVESAMPVHAHEAHR